MLIDLYLLQTYFAEPANVIYEDDLVARYGAGPVRTAISEGTLEHARIPCGSGRRRCVCRLSPKGIAAAQADMALL